MECPAGALTAAKARLLDGEMFFPHEKHVHIQGMKPGHTTIQFSPKKEGREVAEIRHDWADIIDSGIDTKPGQEINDVTIVIGT